MNTTADDIRVGSQAYQPPGWLRNPHLQSVLASTSLRRRLIASRSPGMQASSRRLTLDCGDGVRLYAHSSPQPGDTASRGLVVLIHGWEGCHDSVYLFSMASRLWDAGYSIVRLNLRDHGFSHHLNREPFVSTRLSDPVGALRDIAGRLPGGDNPFLMGFSMGGNMALRTAAAAVEAGLSIRGLLAVSPAINPLATTRAIDEGAALYRTYFRRKWVRSLRAKEAAFPGVHDLDDMREAPTLENATELFAPRFTPYDDYRDYLAAYTLTGRALGGLTVPTHILTAEDDPVIPIDDFANLHLPSGVSLEVTEFGGHCGFIKSRALDCYTDDVGLQFLTSFD
ncbi:alpha/beta fold hydrolase [uncultured Abyssibacter sp.]|uniref:YheT family hydrolase n=1 Tax=uncultured Abyssibacter sp. TaxID=2320202 RepID=UPI0032B1D276